MKTGIELIAIERQEQIDKHGYDANFVKENFQYYDTCQLSWMAQILLSENHHLAPTPESHYPANWPKDEVAKMLAKPYKDRMILAGALLAAEIDRLQNP